MASDTDSVNQICEKVEALEINSKPISKAEDEKTLHKLSNISKENKETRVSGLPSTSQPVAVDARNDVASSAYIAPSSHPAPLVYSYGVNSPQSHVLGTDGYQRSPFVNDFGYHFTAYQNEATPFLYPSFDGGYPSQTFYSHVETPITALGTENVYYGYQSQHPGSLYQHVHYPEYQCWAFPSDNPPLEAVRTVQEDLGIQGAYFHGIQSGNNYFSEGRPEFQSYLLPSHGSYGRGSLPSAFTSSVPLEVANHYDRPVMLPWTDPRNVGNHQSNGFSSGIHTTIGQFVPAVQFPPVQQAVYSYHGATNLHPRRSFLSGVPSSSTQLRISDGVIPYQIETRDNDPEWVVGNKRLVGNQNHFDDGQRIPGGSSDAMQHPTRRPINEELASSGQAKGQNRFSDRVNEILSVLGDRNSYNRSDFITKYHDAKFFVIKSYSEDDIHKSIKYNVWASTPNGNQKLNQAYQDAQLRAGDKPGGCPIFFFFSVNGSGRFCGVAEMVGPVDFSKNMDFWQQDTWTGNFSVKWHIIKDIPNSKLRHIILENNDNKPVTNSRDTQEINIQEGLEMLDIFKNYRSQSSLVDEFYLYESRQRVLQEKRAKQKAHLQTEQGGMRRGEMDDGEEDEYTLGDSDDDEPNELKNKVTNNKLPKYIVQHLPLVHFPRDQYPPQVELEELVYHASTFNHLECNELGIAHLFSDHPPLPPRYFSKIGVAVKEKVPESKEEEIAFSPLDDEECIVSCKLSRDTWKYYALPT
ncbi:hypothetical protein KI387_032606 [Taxus chinensis]|uniref:YTH domain-containing protein n=1 Tax=Taxus chinensis TaxID=29808 RepID=A0AA38F001_TAXCH|nr:hypothetical protein KI387_032606 [Taxus chinensis]